MATVGSNFVSTPPLLIADSALGTTVRRQPNPLSYQYRELGLPEARTRLPPPTSDLRDSKRHSFFPNRTALHHDRLLRDPGTSYIDAPAKAAQPDQPHQRESLVVSDMQIYQQRKQNLRDFPQEW